MKNKAIQYGAAIALALLVGRQAHAINLPVASGPRDTIERLRERRDEIRPETLAAKRSQLIQIITKISQYAGSSERLQAISRAASSAKNIEELRKSAGEIKRVRQDANSLKVRKANMLAQVAVFEDKIVTKAEVRNEKMKQGISILKEKGRNTAELEKMLADAQDDLQKIKTNLKKLAADIQGAANTAVLKAMAVQKILQSARQDIGDVYKAFLDIAQQAQKF